MKVEKNGIQRLTTLFIIIFIVSSVLFSGLYLVNCFIDDNDFKSSDIKIKYQKQNVISALVCGVNDNLTDTIIYVRYNVKTGKIAMMSIPRDLYTENDYSVANKINSIYRNKNSAQLIEEVEYLLGVKIDHYLFFDASMLRDMVDTLGGIKIDVAMRMKYDDPTQDLHIDLYPGLQVLDGDKAEQYVRFRSNNDYTVGYEMGDLDRTKVQQDFIKEFIKTALSSKNISKIDDLIKIAQEDTDTNVSIREALRYVSDLPNIDLDNIYSITMPCDVKYINNISYVIANKPKIEEEIQTNFLSLD